MRRASTTTMPTPASRKGDPTVAAVPPVEMPPTWTAASSPPELSRGEIQIWHLPLVVDDALLEQCLGVLGVEEHARATKFAFPYLRQRYIAAHGMLRMILAAILNCDAGDLEFRSGEHGKPYLVGDALQFNLSHSEEQGMLGVTTLGELGVDVESMERKVEIQGIAQRFFSERETEELFQLESTEQCEGFFNLWTRKEAWLKATGIGISNGLNKIEFNCRPGEPARLLQIEGDEAEAANWHVHTFSTPAVGFVGSVAVREKPEKISFLAFE